MTPDDMTTDDMMPQAIAATAHRAWAAAIAIDAYGYMEALDVAADVCGTKRLSVTT